MELCRLFFVGWGRGYVSVISRLVFSFGALFFLCKLPLQERGERAMMDLGVRRAELR